MNTSALKTFAPAVRKQLMEAVTRKLDFALTAQTPDYLTTFAPQVAALRKLAQADRPGLIERVAYTWFNRLAALRFMDARGWHPFRARVLTPASAAETQPELLKLTRTGALPEELRSHTAPARLNDLLDGRIPSPDAQGEVYRHLVLAACRFYHALLPNLFEKLDDETELLLPDDLLTEHSVVHGFRTEISDEDCGDGQRANVEILGWLYQFYISDKKADVMARKSAVPTEDIPAVTQLFTPHWIVRYLVENSLGRLWLLNRPGSRLREHMPYYIEGETNAPGGSPDDFLKITKPEEIRLCDPAVGSGHMLTYAFDLLTLIYEEEGYAPTEIPALILRHNLHGLEICPRAAQLAELALVFKAREKSRRFFQPEHLVRPHIIELRDVRFAEGELSDYFKALGSQPSALNPQLTTLLYQFEESKNFGSLIQPCLDERAIAAARRAIEAKDLGGQLFLRETHLKVLRVLEQAEALTQRYHVVVANPPYMGGGGMNRKLKDLAEVSFPQSKSDLFAMFVERITALMLPEGCAGVMTPFTWMFIGSYESFRTRLLNEFGLLSLIQPEYHAFFESAFVPICAFVFRNSKRNWKATFINLSEFYGEDVQPQKALEAIRNPECGWAYVASRSDLAALPGSPLAYWASAAVRNLFREATFVGTVATPKQGSTLGENDKFLRFWHEVNSRAVTGKWKPCLKGGKFRKWFGNWAYVVNWDNNGREVKDSGRATIRNESMLFKAGIDWSRIGSSTTAFRAFGAGFFFESASGVAFPPEDHRLRMLGFLNSKIASHLISCLNPTLSCQSGDIAKLPYKAISTEPPVNDLIDASRADWDNFETSWDFRDQPLLRQGLKGATLEASWRNWEVQSTAAIRRMQELETENNRLFIAAYGLDGELQPEVPEAQITLARAEARRDMAAFLSYAVGCMMGRFSLSAPGLILADAGATLEDYIRIVAAKTGDRGQGSGVSSDPPSAAPCSLTPDPFPPDADGIIPVLDGEWFEDDIVARTRDFLRATFGEATLRENLRFIEDSLGKDLRKYFLNDFYKDHLQTYKKRPIYWLVQSPRKGFSVLLYLHRYTRDTMNLVLNRYLRDYQTKMRNRLPQLVQVQATAATAREKTEARREVEKLSKILRECEEWEHDTVLPLAQARIELDLDDGVKTNYLKLGEALATITGLVKEED